MKIIVHEKWNIENKHYDYIIKYYGNFEIKNPKYLYNFDYYHIPNRTYYFYIIPIKELIRWIDDNYHIVGLTEELQTICRVMSI